MPRDGRDEAQGGSGTLLSVATFYSRPVPSQPVGETSMGQSRVKFFKGGNFGHATSNETYMVEEGEERTIDSKTAEQLEDMGCLEILEANIAESGDDDEDDEDEKPESNSPTDDEKAKRRRGRRSRRPAKEKD